MKKSLIFISVILVALLGTLFITACDGNGSGCKHEFDVVEKVEATCVKAGNIKYWHCTVCDNYYMDSEAQFPIKKENTVTPIDSLNHDYEEEIIPASCESDGVKRLVCSRSEQHVIELNVIPASRHNVVASGKCSECDKQIASAGLKYTLNSDGLGYVVGCGSATGKINIYGSYNGLPVTGIAEQGFADKQGVTEVVIGEGVYNIGDMAFSGCADLIKISMPSSIRSMSSNAFLGCKKLNDITIDEDNIYYRSIDNNIVSINSKLLVRGNAQGTIPSDGSVVGIGSRAFEGSEIQSVVIPACVTTIGSMAFNGCNNIKEVHISDISAWCAIDFGGIDANPIACGGKLYCNDKLVEDLVIPSEVDQVKNYAFYKCSSLKSVVIERGATKIGYGAFEACANLVSARLADSVTSIGANAFAKCVALQSAQLPDGLSAISNYLFSGCKQLATVNMPSDLTSIGSESFANCTSLTDLNLPDKLKTVERNAFLGCTSLSMVYVPASVTAMDYFSGCNGVTLFCEAESKPASWDAISVTGWSLSNPVVWNCKDYGMTEDGYKWAMTQDDVMVIAGYTGSDKEMVVPDTINDVEVTMICFNAFRNCKEITSITLPFVGETKDGDVNTNFGYIFGAKDSTYNSGYVPTTLSSVIITGSTKIAELAFQSSNYLTKLVIPASVTSIGSRLVIFSNRDLTIYCEAASKPEGWDINWNYSNNPVVWGYTA